jgi:hypothetical protein
MALDRLYRENIKFSLAYPEAFVNPATPTVAELNNAALVFDITCALDEDGTEFTLGDPDTDDSLSFCDAAGNQTATFKNPSVVYQYYRDADRIAAGVYNLAFDLLAFPDIPYIGILRIGQDSDVIYAAGQKISMVGGRTDLPVGVENSGENARLSTTFLPDGFVNWNKTLS